MPASDSKQNQPNEQIEWGNASILPEGLASRQTDIYRDKLGWKGRKDGEIFLAPEIFSLNSKNMQVELPETTSKIGGPLVRQFSVFLPNKVGAMLEIVKLLNAHATHVVALSVSESTDAAIARIIVSDPERVEELFRENNVAFGVCELMVVELREVATQFIKILATLLMAEVNVHFSYPLLTRPNGRAALAMHVDDSECAASVLQGEGFRLLSQRDISR
jgi:hypothetical protein